MKARQLFRTFVGAALAALLSTFLAGAVHAQDTLVSNGPLGSLHAKEGVGCGKCHGKAKKTEPVSMETCLGCHGDGDSKALAALTVNAKPMNPHENRHFGTETDCNLCHHQHVKSVNYCQDCHPRFDFKVR